MRTCCGKIATYSALTFCSPKKVWLAISVSRLSRRSSTWRRNILRNTRAGMWRIPFALRSLQCALHHVVHMQTSWYDLHLSRHTIYKTDRLSGCVSASYLCTFPSIYLYHVIKCKASCFKNKNDRRLAARTDTAPYRALTGMNGHCYL